MAEPPRARRAKARSLRPDALACCRPTSVTGSSVTPCFPGSPASAWPSCPPFRADVILHLGALLDEHRITFMSSVPALWRIGSAPRAPPRGARSERCVLRRRRRCRPRCGRTRRPLDRRLRGERIGITETASWLAGTAPGATPEDGLDRRPWGDGSRRRVGGDTPAPAAAGTGGDPARPRARLGEHAGLMRGYLGREDLTARAVRGLAGHRGHRVPRPSGDALHLARSVSARRSIAAALKVYPLGRRRGHRALRGRASTAAPSATTTGSGRGGRRRWPSCSHGSAGAMRRVYDWARRQRLAARTRCRGAGTSPSTRSRAPRQGQRRRWPRCC